MDKIGYVECDNIRECHDLKAIKEDSDALRVVCKICHHRYVIRRNRFTGAPENRLYSKLFKRDLLQGNSRLLYKYHPEYLRK